MARWIWLEDTRGLDITTVCGCPNDCYYCPQDAFKAAYHGKPRLSLEDFNTVISALPKDLLISFSGFSEPFLNSDCMNMIESTVSHGLKVSINTTFIGMHEDDVRRLSKLPISYFCAHLPDNKGNAKIQVTEEYKDVLVLALQSLRIDSFSVMNDNFASVDNERAGLLKHAPRRNVRGMFNCGLLEYPHLVLLPNCDVALCCQDFGLRHVLGNLLTSSYDEILSSPAFRSIRANRHRMSGDILCRRCAVATPILEYNLFKASTRTLNFLRKKFQS
jgi:hypothetical protein